MDDCFTESLVYSDSEGSDDDFSNAPENTAISTIEKAQISTENTIETITDGIESPEHSEDEEFTVNNSMRKGRKTNQILSSDDDDENDQNTDEISMGKDSVAHDSVIRPSICDSDTESESQNDQNHHRIKTNLKKKKKEKFKTSQNNSSTNSSDSSDDETDRSQDLKEKKSSKLPNTSSSENSSGSDSNGDDESNNTTAVQPREKVEQRMSAKVAQEQMKEIQSESQRMAREAHISVPYHKPKAHTLQEFLNRRSIVEHQQDLNSKPVLKTAAAIKMSEAELIEYANKIDQRIQESEEFFQDEETDEENENIDEIEENSDIEHDNNATEQSTDNNHVSSNEITVENMVNETDEPSEIIPSPQNPNEVLNENNEISEMLSQQPDTHQPDELSQQEKATNDVNTNIIEFHTERTELDDELDNMDVVAPAKRKTDILSLINISAPKLRGDSGMIIDLETNEMKPKEKTGVDQLVERFVRNAFVKPTNCNMESQDIGIFHAEIGGIEKHKVFFTPDETTLKKETKPGESYFKLQSELSKKIEEKRRDAIAKRVEEEEKLKKEQESDLGEDEFEIGSDSEEECTVKKACVEEICDEEIEEEINEEINDENASENEDNENISENSETSDNENEETVDSTQKRRRIINHGDSDSDEDANEPEKETLNSNQDVASSSMLDDTVKASTLDILSELSLDVTHTNTETSKDETSRLFDETNQEYEEIGESQLMALCSGAFTTQLPKSSENIEDSDAIKVIENQVTTLNQLDFSSDEEENSTKTLKSRTKKYKKKNTQKLIYSDDEDDEISNHPSEGSEELIESEIENEKSEAENIDSDEEIEKYIEYDSDENEIEVELKKKDVKRKATEFFENEAELSGSEISGDEDEKDLNYYEAEKGDQDHFDNDKIRSELERMQLRQQTDQDARELRILTERFVEEEDNGQDRERKFRWKHLNNADFNDQDQNVDQEETENKESDDDNEEEWRRIRYEREQMLKQQINANATTVTENTTALETSESIIVDDNNSTLSSNIHQRIVITKPVVAPPKIASMFLINQNDLKARQLNRKSFLNRDSPTLEKLACLTKSSGDGQTISNKAKGKGNYIFLATEKKETSKRKSDSVIDHSGDKLLNEENPHKKSKLNAEQNVTLRPQTKTFLDSLS